MNVRLPLAHVLRRAGAVAICALLAFAGPALAAEQTGAAARLEQAGFVEPGTIDKTLVLDIRYATTNNFTGAKVYPSARCYLRADVAKRLLAVQQSLRKQSLGIKIYDCYRPFTVQEAFWKIMPDERYVLEPKRGADGSIVKSSRHNRGAAVDVTLVDAKGRELAMPTGFDDFTEAAHRDSPATPEAKKNSLLLERAMKAQGFIPLSTEWWHFDGPGWEASAPLDLPLPADN